MIAIFLQLVLSFSSNAGLAIDDCSVAKGRRLDFRSDIDFAVEGLASAKCLRVGAELEELLDFPADLVELELARPALREQIESYGILLLRED
jgi:predicted nucleotidyltransferase